MLVYLQVFKSLMADGATVAQTVEKNLAGFNREVSEHIAYHIMLYIGLHCHQNSGRRWPGLMNLVFSYIM